MRPALVVALGLTSCVRNDPPVAPPEPTLRRLTVEQYQNTVVDLLGDDVVLPAQVEPDLTAEGLVAIGASVTSISPRGVEQYESAAYDLSEQILLDPAKRDRVISCTPQGTVDASCATAFVEDFGLRVWRRPLDTDEVSELVAVAEQASTTLGDFHEGLVYTMASMMMSPNFLYRAELGQPDAESPSGYRFSDWEMASRLSYLMWNTTPDAELLDAAAAGELTDPATLEIQARRLVEDPRAREGLAAFVTDMFELQELEHLSKDPTVFTQMSAEVGPAALEETLRLIEWHTFDEQGDYRDLYTTRTTFVDRKLASMYDIPAPVREGFGEVELPEDGRRRGLLGHVSVLANNAHPVSTSATLRGKFVRERILCEVIPPPPADLNTSIPEPSPESPTLRDRVGVHLEVALCASCHTLTDPIGLGLENFDGLGVWRSQENDVSIDPSGEVDGVGFADAWELGQVIAEDERVPACLVTNLHRYATGHRETEGELEALSLLIKRFEKRHKHRVKDLLVELVTGPAFRYAGGVQ